MLLLLVVSAFAAAIDLIWPVTFESGWRTHGGDDPRWADPAFDDHDWPVDDGAGWVDL